jgi:hypothetical protein
MKPTQDFTTQNLLWMKGRKVSASIKKHAPTDINGWLDLSKTVEEEIARGTFKYRGLFASSASGKPTLSTASAADALVLRKINDNIRRAYGIRQTQRTQAVKLARAALKEWTPKGIVSVDLKSCFESITPRKVTEKLKQDGRVSNQTIYLLDLFFKQAKRFGANKYTKGLPRGILISSTLAELYLKELDNQIALTSGLYIYIRYVDDILAISASRASELFSTISKAINDQGLSLNAAKSRVVDAGCECSFICKHAIGKCPCANGCTCNLPKDNFGHVDYLGYKLIFNTGKKLKKTSECYALIADNKCDKIRRRIALAFSSYKKSKNFPLLDDRLRFLTSNITIDKSLKKSKLLSGIAYTYDQYCAPPVPHPFESSTLEYIDRFLRTKARKLCVAESFTYMQRRSLLRHSFYYGQKNRHRTTFSAARMREIRSCW